MNEASGQAQGVLPLAPESRINHIKDSISQTVMACKEMREQVNRHMVSLVGYGSDKTTAPETPDDPLCPDSFLECVEWAVILLDSTMSDIRTELNRL